MSACSLYAYFLRRFFFLIINGLENMFLFSKRKKIFISLTFPLIGCEMLSKAFSAFIEMIMFLIIQCVNAMHHIY